jgi:hypothetical protein
MIPSIRKLTSAMSATEPWRITALDEVGNGVPPENLIAAW